MASAFHSSAISGGPTDRMYSRSVSAPYSRMTSSGATVLPFDLDMISPSLWTMPCGKSRVMGSSKSTRPRSRMTLVQKRE